VGDIAKDMDIRFIQQGWTQEMYYKLWRHSMSCTPIRDNADVVIDGAVQDDYSSVYSDYTEVVNSVSIQKSSIKDYSDGTVVSTILSDNKISNINILKSSDLLQMMYNSKTSLPDRIAVMPFVDDRDAVEVSICQQLFEQIMDKDPSRIRNVQPIKLYNKDGLEILDASGNSYTNIYKIPLFENDKIEIKVNVMVNQDNVKTIFDKPTVTMSQDLINLNASFNSASTSTPTDEHVNYVSYLVKLRLISP